MRPARLLAQRLLRAPSAAAGSLPRAALALPELRAHALAPAGGRDPPAAHAALAGDYERAYATQEVVYRLNKAVYRFGEPSSDAHQRMKMAMHLQGRFPSTTVRPPLRPLDEADIQRIRDDLAESGFDEWYGTRGLLQEVDASVLAVG